MADPVLQYTSLQYALYTTGFACVLGGASYLFTTLFVVADRKNAEAITHGTGPPTFEISSFSNVFSNKSHFMTVEYSQ